MNTSVTKKFFTWIFLVEAVRRRIEDATRDLENLQLDTERAMKKSSKLGAKVSNQEDSGDDDDGDEEGFEGRGHSAGTVRGHHVYTGESLLEMVLADHSFKYNHDNQMLSGAHTRGEHKVFTYIFFCTI